MLDKKEIEMLLQVCNEKNETEMFAEPGHEGMDDDEYTELLTLIDKLRSLLSSM